MNPPVNNIQRLCESLDASHGEISLAGLFRPDGERDQWDFVIAATWLSGSLSDYQLIARELKRFLSPGEMPGISRIVILPPGNMAWLSFQGGTGTPSVLGMMRDFVFNGERIEEAYIIASSAARLASKVSHRAKKHPRVIKPNRVTHGPHRSSEAGRKVSA